MKKNNNHVLSHAQVDKKNFGLSVINGVVFKAGFEYVNAFTIVSVFIHTITGSIALAGLAQFIQTFFSQLGRFVQSPKLHAIKNQPKYMGKVNLYSRIMWAILSVMLFLDTPNFILVPSIFILMAVSWFLGGLTWPVFEDHFARTILPRRRSELLGYRETIGGILAFIGTFIVKSILGSNLVVNNKYGILFMIGSIMLIASSVPLFFMKDPYHKVDKNPMSLFKVLKNAPNIINKEKKLQMVSYY
jgi:hypothetical protein